MTAVRAGRVDEVDAAVAVWRAANPGRADSPHAARLPAWATLPGSALLVAPGPASLHGMVLVLAGRADDGAGDLVPGLVHLTGLAVTPAAQGHGVGKALLTAAVAEADRRAADRVTLWAAEGNLRARRLFGLLGFVLTGRVGDGVVHFELRR